MGFARFFAAPARGWWLVPMCGPAGHPDGRGARGLIGANALAEAVNSLYKTELIRQQGPWRGVDDVELATLGWVHWFNTGRLHGTLDDIPPAEFEAAYNHQQETSQSVGIQ